jgi:arylamine N-acetyltransferase
VSPAARLGPADRLLGHLGLGREAPTLDYLDRIIREHQMRVPFETLTKLVDYEPGLRRGDFLPPIGDYVERIVTRGAGGLCWTLARGLHFLLADIGFDVAFMYMDPGHCCVRVELPDGPYYADVGYAAPIFQAYPLFESFTLDTHRETFDYRVREDGIFVTRNPGPAKKLDPTPRRIEDLRELIRAANDWSTPLSFLHRLAYAGHVGGVYTSIRDGTLTRYLPGGPEKRDLAAAEVPAALADIFRADPALYFEAAEVQRRYRPAARGRRSFT